MWSVKEKIAGNPIYSRMRDWSSKRRRMRRQASQIEEWQKNGRPVPPPHAFKQHTLRQYARDYGLRVLVETGTYQGRMIKALENEFDRIYSIELSEDLCEKARALFERAKHVEIIQGDSGVEMGRLVARLDQPALFWLDGHYIPGTDDTARGDRDTPIYQELDHILRSKDKGHVIIIDDARCFGTDPDYPTIEELTRFILSKLENVEVSVKDDSIRITPVARPASS